MKDRVEGLSDTVLTQGSRLHAQNSACLHPPVPGPPLFAGSFAVGATGAVLCTTSAFGVGSHSISASYSGDGNFNGSSSSSPIVKTVGKAATTTSLSVPASPPVKGQPVTITAAVAVRYVHHEQPDRWPARHHRHLCRRRRLPTSTSSASTLYANTDLGASPRQPNGAYDLRNMNLRGAYLVGVSLVSAALDTVNLQDAVLIGADLTGVTGVLSNLSGANLTNAVMKNASFKDTTFKNATFTGANLTGSSFTGATLKDAIGLNSATLTGVTWTQTTCPNGSNSGATGGTCVGRW